MKFAKYLLALAFAPAMFATIVSPALAASALQTLDPDKDGTVDLNEAKTAAAVLGANYPGSSWYKDSYDLLVTHNMKPVEDKGSWISRAFKSPL